MITKEAMIAGVVFLYLALMVTQAIEFKFYKESRKGSGAAMILATVLMAGFIAILPHV